MQQIKFDIFADYFQFYLNDAEKSPPAPEDWTDDDAKKRLKVIPYLIVICPVRNMTVPVTLEVCDSEPTDNFDTWDHVAECSLDIPSGKLVVDECTGSPAANIDIAPGCYRVRIFYGDLDSLSEDGLEGDDHYKIVMWRDAPIDLKVLKQWEGE